jgi:hypothetical protein
MLVPFWFSVKGKPKLAVKKPTNFDVKEENAPNIILLPVAEFMGHKVNSGVGL